MTRNWENVTPEGLKKVRKVTFKMSNNPLLLTLPEAAKSLKISRGTLYNLINSHKINSVHIGQAARITQAELDRFVFFLEHPPTGEVLSGDYPTNEIFEPSSGTTQ